MTEMALSKLRRAHGFSQEDLAPLLDVSQPSIAKLEYRSDMYISTLRTHIGRWAANWNSSRTSQTGT